MLVRRFRLALKRLLHLGLVTDGSGEVVMMLSLLLTLVVGSDRVSLAALIIVRLSFVFALRFIFTLAFRFLFLNLGL
jgi:hypothetical protein